MKEKELKNQLQLLKNFYQLYTIQEQQQDLLQKQTLRYADSLLANASGAVDQGASLSEIIGFIGPGFQL